MAKKRSGGKRGRKLTPAQYEVLIVILGYEIRVRKLVSAGSTKAEGAATLLEGVRDLIRIGARLAAIKQAIDELRKYLE